MRKLVWQYRVCLRAIILKDVHSKFIATLPCNMFNIMGIKHSFSCIDICQVTKGLLKTETEFNHNATKIRKTAGHYFSVSSPSPCRFQSALCISIKILVSCHGQLSWFFFLALSSSSEVKDTFSIFFSLNIACSSIVQYPNLTLEYKSFPDTYNCKLVLAPVAGVLPLILQSDSSSERELSC